MSAVISLVNPQSATLSWYVVRGSGIVAFLLLTCGVLSGLLLSLRWRSGRWPRLLTEDLHQFLQLLAGVFVAIHIVSTLLDSFVRFEWYQVLVPFTAHYRVLWLSLGIMALYLSITLAVSIYLRGFIGYRAWRAFHYLGFAAWLLALAHALGTGTDARNTWALGVYAASIVAVVLLLAVRFGGVPLHLGRPPRLRPRVLATLGLALVVGGTLIAVGPLQPGWAARVGLVSPSATNTIGPRVPFQDTLSGAARPYNRYILDPGYWILTVDTSGRGPNSISLGYRLLVMKTKTGIRFLRGLYAMAPASAAWHCSGTVTFHPPDRLVSVCHPAARRIWRLIARIHILAGGRVQGTIAVSPGPRPRTWRSGK